MVISLLCVLFTTNTFAYDFEYTTSNGQTLYFNILDKSAKTVAVTFKNSSGNSYTLSKYDIPARISYNGTAYDVTEIGESAFWGCTSVKSVTMPYQLKKIADQAFYNCSSLQTIGWSGYLESIGSYAFSGCSSLTTANLPSSLTTINPWAFKDCTNLRNILIPANVKTIAECAFYSCYNATIHYQAPLSAIFWNGLGNSFTNCNNATFIYEGTEDLSQQRALQSVASSSIRNLELNPQNETQLGSHAFDPGYGGIEITIETLTIPVDAKISSIDAETFSNCKNLATLNIQCGNYKSSGNMLFQDASGGDKKAWNFVCATPYASTVIIPDNIGGAPVTGIGNHAFFGYKDITAVYVPASVTQLGYWAFDKYQKLIVVMSDKLDNNSSIVGTPTIMANPNIIEDIKLRWTADRFNFVPLGSSSNNDEDVNNDGKVNATDAMLIYNYILSH